MKKFEYHVFTSGVGKNIKEILNGLNECGEEGWEVFHLQETMLRGELHILIWCKREKSVAEKKK